MRRHHDPIVAEGRAPFFELYIYRGCVQAAAAAAATVQMLIRVRRVALSLSRSRSVSMCTGGRRSFWCASEWGERRCA